MKGGERGYEKEEDTAYDERNFLKNEKRKKKKDLRRQREV